MSANSLQSFNHCLKFGAPALAVRIALVEFNRTKQTGDAINNSKWCARCVMATDRMFTANEQLRTANR